MSCRAECCNIIHKYTAFYNTVFFILLFTQDIVLETDTEFWISVCCEFSVIEQLQSLMKLLDYLTNLPENKEGNFYQRNL